MVKSSEINANGLIYGSPEDSTDYVPILDPVNNVASEMKHPVRDPARHDRYQEILVAV